MYKTGILGLMIISTIIGGIMFFVSYNDTRTAVEKHEKADPKCFVQFIDDHPYSIVVDESEYMLESGKMSLKTRTFLNPWHQEIINSGVCKRVNLVAPDKNRTSNTNKIVFTEL